MKKSKVKTILSVIIIILLAAVAVSAAIAIPKLITKKNCTEHVFVNGVCTNCGQTEEESIYTLDIISVNANIKIYMGGEKQSETFGAGIQYFQLSSVFDNVEVILTSSYGDDTQINVYKCVYVEDGEYVGYTVSSTSTLLEDKSYNKEKVATLSALNPLYEVETDVDCLYIFELFEGV